MASKGLTVRGRLALGFGAATALGVVIAGLATWQMRSLAGDLKEVAEERIPKIERATHMKDNFNSTGRYARNIVIYSDPQLREGEKKKIAEARADNARLIGELDKIIVLPKAR